MNQFEYITLMHSFDNSNLPDIDLIKFKQSVKELSEEDKEVIYTKLDTHTPRTVDDAKLQVKLLSIIWNAHG